MTEGRPQPDIEVLDDERPPSALQQWATRTLRRPLVRAAIAVPLAVVLVGAWSVLPRDQPVPVDDGSSAAADTPPGLRPPPPRGRESPTGSWRVADDLSIRTGPRGHTIVFSATNGGARAKDPRELEVTGGFVDRPGLTYVSTCAAVERSPGGYRTIRGSIGPRRTVLVRCRDVTAYGGRTAWIDPTSVVVRRKPCESEASSLPM